MVKIKDFTLESKNLGGARAPPVPYTPPAHAYSYDKRYQRNIRTEHRIIHRTVIFMMMCYCVWKKSVIVFLKSDKFLILLIL